MKLTFNQWAQYPTTEEAQHRLRYINLLRLVTQSVKSGYTDKIKLILTLMGYNKFIELEEDRRQLKDFEIYFKHFTGNKQIKDEELRSLIYPKYPPAPYFAGKRFA